MVRGIPKARGGSLHQYADGDTSLDPIIIGTAAWYSWLEQHRSFCFEAGRMTFTARREQRPGGRYWYAYRRSHGKLHTAYLGKSEDLTLERLNTRRKPLSEREVPARAGLIDPCEGVETMLRRFSRTPSSPFQRHALYLSNSGSHNHRQNIIFPYNLPR